MVRRATLLIVLLASPPLLAATQSEHQLGEVELRTSCEPTAQEEINIGTAQLHHMMYERARPHFEAAAEHDPDCAMAHWGRAMTRFQPLWHPTDDDDLQRGREHVEDAEKAAPPTERERRYVEAVAAFFADPEPAPASPADDHGARLKNWLEAQRELHEAYPEDVDAAAFYALAEVSLATAQFSPEEEPDFTRERRAGALLERYFDEHPRHPALYHYRIHAYDSSELAAEAEQVAREYDRLAPETPHALHMPSHTFVRLGDWEETVEWNERSADAALRHPVDGKTSVHYPHALDYLMYALLQLGDEEGAREVLDRVREIEDVQPDFASAYGIAAAQARYSLERRQWREAARIEVGKPDALSWSDHPAAEAQFRYARGLGAARSGDLAKAEREHERLASLVEELGAEGDAYWKMLTEAQADAVRAWLLYEQEDEEAALRLMSRAADLEESIRKHPTTPGEVLPVRELYGDLLLREGEREEAVAAYESALDRTPDRRYSLAGIERAKDGR